MAAPTPLAEVSDLAEWLGQSISAGAETAQAGWALRMASALVRAEVGMSWLDADGNLGDPPEAAVLVALAVAGRVYLNPDGTVASESIDDYQYREDSPGEVGVYLTASERGLLGKLTESYQGGIGTVTTERGDIYPWPCDEDERLLPPYY